MPSRLGTALLGVVLSLAVSVVVWQAFDTLLFFLFVPFVPFLLGRNRRTQPTGRTCPNCDFHTTDAAVRYCPYDGARLQDRD